MPMDAFPHVSYAAKSDIGRKRKNNEDSFGVFPSLGIFCVADGMGGGDDGEVASAETVRAVETFVSAHPLPVKATFPIGALVAGIRGAVNAASAWIADRAARKHLKGCGSTFVGVCFDAANPAEAMALHAGDSRLYRIRGRTIRQITKDHSAAELIGAKDEREINPMFRGMILRAVGIQPTVDVESTPLPLKEGDRILICSDGLCRMVPDKKILSVVREHAALNEAVDALIAAANAAGGVDNITVELLQVGRLPSPLPTVEMPTDGQAPANPAQPEARDPDADPDTGDTRSETGVSFDAVSGTETNGSNREVETRTCSTMEIPESDTEDDVVGERMPPDEPDTPASEDAPTPDAPAGRRAVRRVPVRSLLIAGAVLGVAAFGCGVGCLIKTKAEAKRAAEAARQADVARAAEEARRVEEQRKMQEEAARIAAEKQAEEARRKEAAERKRLEERERQERERAARREAERLEAIRREREAKEAARRAAERKAQEEAEREKARLAAEKEAEREKARLAAEKEAERKARETEQRRREQERKAAEEAARLEKARREQAETVRRRKAAEALAAFEAVCETKVAALFVNKVSGLIAEDVPATLCMRFRPLTKDAGTPEGEKAAAARALTQDVQAVVGKLTDYAHVNVKDAEGQLMDPLTTSEYRKELRETLGRMKDFLERSRAFTKGDPADPNTQFLCVLMIRSVPRWF